MITKERLEELIEKGATIYLLNDFYSMEIRFDNVDIRKGYKIINNDLVFGVNNPTRIQELDNLYETREEAEWNLKFGNITRTESLSLPSWEEFCDCKYSNEFTFFANGFEYNLFATVRNKEFGEPDTLIIGTNDLKMACGYDEIFEKAYTKENYIKACELAKKLFLGEEE